MRKSFCSLVLSCALLFLATHNVWAVVLETDSKIISAVVYTNRALITRSAVVNLAAGTNQVVFKDIIPEVDENTLRVSGMGVSQTKILGAQVKREFLKEEASAQVQGLQSEMEGLMDERRALENGLQGLVEERGFLAAFGEFSHAQIPQEIVTKMPATKDLDDLLKFYGGSLKKNYLDEIEVQKQLRDLDKKINLLQRKMSEFSSSPKTKRSVVVDLESAKAGSLTLKISYLVNHASWQPIYEARASVDNASIELVSGALVKQTTGEPWDDIDMSLSTAQPDRSGRLPDPKPWVLRLYQPQRVALYKEASKRSYAAMDQALGGASADSDKMESQSVPEAVALESAEMAYATPQQKGISVQYKIPRKANVLSNGADERLPIGSQVLAAEFKYCGYPRVLSNSYLTSRVKNSSDVQLLAGRLNVFLGDDFVGPSSLDNIGTGEEFDIYLGVDDNVGVKREEIEKKTDDVLIGNIASPNKRLTYRYKITVENHKNKKIKYELFEAMPVSEDERIKVKIDHVSVEPKEKNWRDKKGIWRWEFSLEPGAKQEIEYSLLVECARNLNIDGL